MSTDPATAALDLGDAIVMLVKGVIPTTQAQVDCMNQYFPAVCQRRLLRAQVIKEKEILQAADFVKKHNLNPTLFASYVNGNATFDELVKEAELNSPPVSPTPATASK